jgi:uncharacterized protein involved in exopolysaccharide biosynthesis
VAESPGLLFWIGLVRRHIRFLAMAFGLGAVLSVGVALALPSWYRARASILPPHERTYPGPLGGISAALHLDSLRPFGGGVTQMDIHLGILHSALVRRRLMERYSLPEYYRTPSHSRALDTLARRSEIGPTSNFVIVIDVEDRDPAMAADLANAYVEELDRVLRESLSSSARRQRAFLEERLAESEAGLDSLDRALARLQEGGGVTVLGRDETEAARAAGDLMGRRIALGVQLDMLDTFRIEDAPIRRRLQAELSAVEAEIARLPGMGIDLARLLRDARIQEYLHGVLVEQLETARLEEARDTPTVQVLDRAVAPDARDRPRRSVVAVAGTLLAVGLALALLFYRETSSRER